jgi:putative SOS response-associated peptidase YedK
MCGRFVLYSPLSTLDAEFSVQATLETVARYNIAPSQEILVIRNAPGSNKREGKMMKWGLLPFWAKDPKIAHRLINARCESAKEKPAFRTAFKKRRCLIPANGFFEWKKEKRGKQPYYFNLLNKQLFAFAGLWESWKSEDNLTVETCTILTTECNSMISELHDRMPVIIKPEQYGLWLDNKLLSLQDESDLFLAFPSKCMQAYPVNCQVNKPDYDCADCIIPLDKASNL